MRGGEGQPAVEEPCLSCLLPCWEVALLSSCLPCWHVCLWALHSKEEREASSLGLQAPFLVSSLHLDTTLPLQSGRVPFSASLASSTFPFRHNPTAFLHAPESQPWALLPELLPCLRLPFSFKSPAQHLSTEFLQYSQDGEHEE